VRGRPRHIGTVAVAAFLALALAGILAPAFGWRLDVVRSGSMSPAINVGDLAVTSPERPEDLEVGDVACYRTSDGSYVCHRIMAMDGANSTSSPRATPTRTWTRMPWPTGMWRGR